MNCARPNSYRVATHHGYSAEVRNEPTPQQKEVEQVSLFLNDVIASISERGRVPGLTHGPDFERGEHYEANNKNHRRNNMLSCRHF